MIDDHVSSHRGRWQGDPRAPQPSSPSGPYNWSHSIFSGCPPSEIISIATPTLLISISYPNEQYAARSTMELKSKATVCVLLLLLLVLSPHGGDGGGGRMLAAEARVCTGKSARHSFPCISDRHCSDDCIKERGGWTAGYCRRATCTCQRAC